MYAYYLAEARMETRHDIPMALRAAYLSMHRQTNVRLSGIGITADQFVLLALLEEEDGITQQQLVRRADSDPNTVRAMLILLERQGLICRDRHPTDGRAWKVTLTRKGRQILKRSGSRTRTIRDRMVALFTARELGSLARYLSRISNSLSPSNLPRTQIRPKAIALSRPERKNH